MSRRSFLGGIVAVPAVANAAETDNPTRDAQGNRQGRTRQAFNIRVDAARLQRDSEQANSTGNGDESLYPNKIASFSKGLPHNALGEVDLNAFNSLVDAMNAGSRDAMEQIPMGGGTQTRLLTNPCSGLAFDMQGADSHHLSIAPAPRFSSAQQAGEAVELYWKALLRDVPFSEYGTHPLAQEAAAELSKLSDFRGPKVNGKVTPSTLFRGFTAGDTAGPWVSQFLVRPVPFGSQYIHQNMRTVLPGTDYLTNYSDWLKIQNGFQPDGPDRFDSRRTLIRNGRDIGQWVHVDVLFQAYFQAALLMMAPPDSSDDVTGGGMGVPLNPGNPYNHSRTMMGFGTFGGPAIATAVAEVSTRALKGVWYQKWFVHRRLRPEQFGGRVHNVIANKAGYPVHSDVLNSAVVQKVFSKYGSYLLPVAFPEGSPLHPSYGAGHATVAGACVTMLKALFDESFAIKNPLVPASDGQSVVPYTGLDADKLTVGGELNKLAANVALGRNFAGVHWRTDYTESLRLGEAITISILRDQRLTYNEEFEGYTFTKFDGTKITV